MKVADLLEADIPRISTNRRPLQKSAKHKILGRGVQGMAQQHARDPNKVIKTSEIYHENPEKDEYVQFIKLILDHQDNPFFPRIHKAKLVYNNRTDTYELVAVMEKLVSLRNEKIRDVAEHLFNQMDIKVEDAVVHERDKEDFRWLFDWFKDPENRKKIVQHSKNPQFKQAMKLLEPYIQKYGQDLHGGNIMVRLTGHGPQLVIIDPFSISD